MNSKSTVEAVSVDFVEMSLFYKERHDLHAKSHYLKRIVEGSKCSNEPPGNYIMMEVLLTHHLFALDFSTIIIVPVYNGQNRIIRKYTLS